MSQIVHTPTATDLLPGGADYAQLREWAEEQEPRIGREPLDEIADRLDGEPWRLSTGEYGVFDLGTSYSSPVFKAVRKALKDLRRELELYA